MTSKESATETQTTDAALSAETTTAGDLTLYLFYFDSETISGVGGPVF